MGPIGQRGPQSQFIAKPPSTYQYTLKCNTRRRKRSNYAKNLNTAPPDTKTQNHLVEKRERIPPPAELSCSAANSGG